MHHHLTNYRSSGSHEVQKIVFTFPPPDEISFEVSTSIELIKSVVSNSAADIMYN